MNTGTYPNVKKGGFMLQHMGNTDVCEDWACIKLCAFLGLIVEWDFKKYSTPNKNVLGVVNLYFCNCMVQFRHFCDRLLW